MSSVHIVVVNYRTAGITAECLRALAPEVAALPGCRVTVVEGGSGDGSAEKLAAAIRAGGWSGWCELLTLGENRGFAAGNNAAIRPLLAGPSPPDFMLLLNPDTVPQPGAVRALVDFLVANPAVGIAGSRLEDPDGTPQRSAFRFPSTAGEFEGAACSGPVSRLLGRWVVAPPVRGEAHRADWVAGASMIVRRAVFKSIGLLDEGYFLYYEETDFCLRARRAGWPCWYLPASRVVHLVGQSSGVTTPGRAPKRLPAYWFESRARFFRRNHGPAYAALASAAWLLGHALWRLRAAIQRRPSGAPAGVVGDFVRHNFLRPARQGAA